MRASGPFSKGPRGIDTGLLARSMADDFPYRPAERKYLRHPSRRGRADERRRQFSLTGSGPDDIRSALEGMREAARTQFAGMTVLHLEVFADLDDMIIGYLAVVSAA